MPSVADFRTVRGVAQWRLCLGCGACANICPENKIGLVDVVDEGIRPLVAAEDCGDCRKCLLVCPAVENDHRHMLHRPGIDVSLYRDFGPVLEIWEGHATDEQIRHLGASGGALTALALHCLERGKAGGVLHLQPDSEDPLRNRARFSRSRLELIAGTGSRYAPGSVCAGLDWLESANAPSVFIGQPCEVTALRKAQALKPALADKVALALSFFCAGSPSTKGTLELLRGKGIDLAAVREVRYRGMGWPGMFSVREGGGALREVMSYKDSWGKLQRFRPYGVYLFPDPSGEDADISCADAWGRAEGGPGHSIIVVRTERGRRALRDALRDAYLTAGRVGADRLLEAQRVLVNKRGATWGRVLTFRLLGLPAPRLKGFKGAAGWWRMPVRGKLRSTLGTARRILQRRYYRPLRLPGYEGFDSEDS